MQHRVARTVRSRGVAPFDATDVPECTEAVQSAMPIPGGANQRFVIGEVKCMHEEEELPSIGILDDS
jgi:hypothetical protein